MYNDLKREVEKVLMEKPETRDCDKRLVWNVWENLLCDSATSIYYADFLSLPASETITRLRRIIQNTEKRYLPSSLEIALKRKIHEEEWRNYINGGMLI